MKQVTVTVETPAPQDDALLLFPRPFEHWGQHFVGIETGGGSVPFELTARNADQRAYAMRSASRGKLTIRYAFVERDGPAPPSVWQVQDNRLTRADEGLVALARDIAGLAATEKAALHALMDYAGGLFGYGHPEERFNDGLDSVPAVCGTTRGSCVDINTFLLAAARSLGMRGQYIAGYWFHPDRTETLDMHCWLAFEADGDLLFWDLAHHLKWGVTPLAPGLNPAGGRRVAMSCGRGLIFETANGAVEISHFSEPVWVLPGGRTVEPKIRAAITEDVAVPSALVE